MTETDNLFNILGVAEYATKDEIKKAYHSKSRLLHPDLNPDDSDAQEKFIKLNDAFNILVDDEKRNAYMRSIKPVESVQDLLLRHPAGKKFTEIMLETAPKAPQRGVDMLMQKKVSRNLLIKGGTIKVEIPDSKQVVEVALPAKAIETPWLCLKNFGGVGRNGGERGDLWLVLKGGK